MTLLVCWLLLPLVLAVVALGCGLLVERGAGFRLPGVLLAPVGVAAIIVVAQLAVTADATAELAAPAAVALAIAGVALSPRRRERELDPWALGAAAAAFACFAAPVLFSGQATFAGYLRLDDTSVWLAITDHVMEQGRSLDALEPSSFEAVLDQYLTGGYPVGSFLGLGVAQDLVGQDTAWAFQPYLAFLGAMLALCLYSLAGRVISSPPVRAVAAFVAAQPALLFGYALVGGIKELTAAFLIPLVGALLIPVVEEAGIRRVLPLAVAAAAAFAALSFGAAVWLAPLLLAGLVWMLRFEDRLAALRQAGAFAGFVLVLSLPFLPALVDFLDSSSSVLTSESELGNLFEPLSAFQVLGVWPVGDFRLDPDAPGLSYFLIAVVGLAAIGGVVWAWLRGAWELSVFVMAVAVSCLVVAVTGAPWVDAKGFAIASPVLVLAAMIGAGLTFERVPVAGVLVAGAVAVGVLWSNVLAYHDVNLAPRDRLAELEEIGERIDGEGPTLMTQFELYGPRHFLRASDPEGAAILGRRKVPLTTGKPLRPGGFQDIDGFRLAGILQFRTLVLGRAPTAGRPPSSYTRVWKGDYYEVWQRPARPAETVRAHLPFGDIFAPAAAPRCRTLLKFARQARGGRLAFVERTDPLVVQLSQVEHPPTWGAIPQNPGVLVPTTSPGSARALVQVPVEGRYEVWIGSAFRRNLAISVDGKELGDRTHELQLYGEYTKFGERTLSVGAHQVELRYGGADAHPGSGGVPFPFGPLVLGPGTDNVNVSRVGPKQVRRLCGRKLDWVEAVG
jgi:hypothetical protein